MRGNTVWRPRAAQADRCTLQRLAILSVLPDGALDALAAGAWITCHHREDEIDWQQEEGPGVILGVLEGELGISLLSAEGRELPVLRMGEGEIVDLGVDGWTGTDATVVTVTSLLAIVCVLPAGAFERAVTADCEAMRLLLAAHKRWRRELCGLVGDRLHLSPGVRIRHILWRDSLFAPSEGICYVQSHLAARAGTDQPRVSKEIERLRRENVIERGRKGRIRVVLRDRLVEG